MLLPPGNRLGSYEIEAHIGSGGVGEVEAKLLASLNHPHIAQIYGFEELVAIEGDQPHTRALVMELVEGQSLAARIAIGPLLLEEVLLIALQIAQALEAAHERGIVHRDLKPANIHLTPGWAVKVLDFGLARDGKTLALIRGRQLVVRPWRDDNGRFDVGPERIVTQLAFGSGWAYGSPYDVTDGGRFLALVRVDATPPPRIRIVLGWSQEVRRLGSVDGRNP